MRSTTAAHPFVDEGIGSLKVNPPEEDRTYFKGRDIFQVLLFCTQDEEERYSRFKEFDLVRWHERSTDVLPSGGSKAEGIKKSLKNFRSTERILMRSGTV